ncbi:MAG: hypothetical protein P8Z49_02845 [Acidobacteriota bacterium]
MQRVKTILGLLVIAGLFAVVVPVHRDMRALTKTYPGDYQAYFIPSSGYMKVMSLGYRNFWADLLYLWTLQYYDYYNMKVRYTYLHHTFEVITDLDPKFREAYIMGALFAFINKDWKLLYQMEDKGIEKNPKDYIIPYDAGCYALFSEKNYTRAIHYFRIALRRNPDQPFLKDLLANVREPP